jgi:elongation factor Ts
MITAQQVKELRDRTGISMMDCKDALSEANGDIEKAIEILRKKSIIKAEKKSTRATNEGAIVAGGSSNNYFLIEVNTETDFAANDQEFKKFLTDLTEFCKSNKLNDLDDLQKKFNDKTLEIIQKIGENIKISYFEKITSENDSVYMYVHSDNKLASLVHLEKNDDELGKDIAMQVSANAPLAIYPDEIDQQILDKEKEIALATIENEKKPDEIKEKIVMGKLKKFKDENSLTEQAFIKNPDFKIKDLPRLRDNKILGFLRKKVGE